MTREDPTTVSDETIRSAAPADASAWRLAIDLGTTYTSATTEHGGRTDLLMIDGQPRITSTVALDENGELLAGIGAERVLARAPERAERNPKRRIGDEVILLGDRNVAVVDALAAILALVAGEARRRFGGSSPSELVLTHPARWGAIRLGRLVEAALQVGLPEPTLVSEPIAAAWAATTTATFLPGQTAAIYDLGGGTLDIAVVRRGDDGFDVMGPPGGSDRIGGESFDERLYVHLGEQLGQLDPDGWEHLRFSTDRTWRRAAHEFREQVRSSKEALSVRTDDTLYLGAPIDRELRLTRDELAAVLDAEIGASVAELDATIRRAGLTADSIDHVFLVGGGSRMPLVAQRVADWLGAVPTTWGDPKSVVAIGALAAADVDGRRLAGVAPTAAVPVIAGEPAAAPEPEPDPPAERRRPRALVFAGSSLVAALLLVAGALWALRSGDSDASTAATTSSTSMATSTSTSSTSSTSTSTSTTSTSSTTTTTSSTSTSSSTTTDTPSTTAPADTAAPGGSSGGQSGGSGGQSGGGTQTPPQTTQPPAATPTTAATTPPTAAPTTLPTTPPDDRRSVPSVVGMDYSAGASRVLEQGFTPSKNTVTCTDGTPSSQIISQSHTGKQNPGTVVTLTVCL